MFDVEDLSVGVLAELDVDLASVTSAVDVRSTVVPLHLRPTAPRTAGVVRSDFGNFALLIVSAYTCNIGVIRNFKFYNGYNG